MDFKIKTGDLFESYEEFRKKFDEYCKATYCVTSTRSSRRLHLKNEALNKKIVFKELEIACKHYGHPRIRKMEPCEKTRENTSSGKIDCKFRVKIAFNAREAKLKAVNVNLEHNHKCSRKAYKMYSKNRKLTNDEVEEIKKAIQLGAPVRNVAQQMSKSTGKVITNRTIFNIRNKTAKPEVAEDNNFAETIKAIKVDPNNYVDVKLDADGNVQACFICFKEQKDWFSKYSEMINIDSTYKINIENYILFIFIGQNAELRGIPLAFCFLNRETRENLNYMYSTFNKVIFIFNLI